MVVARARRGRSAESPPAIHSTGPSYGGSAGQRPPRASRAAGRGRRRARRGSICQRQPSTLAPQVLQQEGADGRVGDRLHQARVGLARGRSSARGRAPASRRRTARTRWPSRTPRARRRPRTAARPARGAPAPPASRPCRPSSGPPGRPARRPRQQLGDVVGDAGVVEAFGPGRPAVVGQVDERDPVVRRRTAFATWVQLRPCPKSPWQKTNRGPRSPSVLVNKGSEGAREGYGSPRWSPPSERRGRMGGCPSQRRSGSSGSVRASPLTGARSPGGDRRRRSRSTRRAAYAPSSGRARSRPAAASR